MMRIVYLSLLLILLFLISSAQTNYFIQEIVDGVSQDSLVSYIGALQSFGTRYEFTAQQESSATYILNSMLNTGAQAESDWYNFGTTNFFDLDIIGENTVCVVGKDGDIANSNDGGTSWTAGAVPEGIIYLYGVDFVNVQRGWAVGFSGRIIATTDGGNNWIAQYSGVVSALTDIAMINDTTGIVVGSYGRILRTYDGGATWSRIVSGTNQHLRELCAVDSSHIWAVGDTGTILFSTDCGLTWEKQQSADTSILFGVDFTDADNGWAVSYSGGIQRTTNGGAKWDTVTRPSGLKSYLRAVSFLNDTTGLVVDRYGIIFKTANGGKNWNQVYMTVNVGAGPFLYRVKRYGSRKFVAVGWGSCILTSSDGGDSWIPLTENLPSNFVHTSRNIVATIPGTVSPDKECIMVAHYDSFSYEDTTVTAPGADDNASGTSAVMEAVRVLKNYRFESTVKLLAVSGEETGTQGSSNYAYRSFVQGKNIYGVVDGDMIGFPTTGDTNMLMIATYFNRNWLVDSTLVYNQRYGLGLNIPITFENNGGSDHAPFALLGYDAIYICEPLKDEMGWENPFYHHPSDSLDKLCPYLIRKAAQLMIATVAELAKPIGRITSINGSNQSIPKEFCLEQNYPNPFNPTTTIKYRIPDIGTRHAVSLRIFNLLGREVATLVNENKPAGNYQVTWNASTMSSGVYFYQLKSGNFVETKKMLLLK